MPGLARCHSQGDTYEEAVEHLKDAIQLHIEVRRSLGEHIPQDVSVDRIEVHA